MTRPRLHASLRRAAALLVCLGTLNALSPVSGARADATPSPSPSASPSASPDPSPPPSPHVLRLEHEAAQLEQQILGLQLQSAPIQQAAVQAQQQSAAAQAQLSAAQLALANANVALADTTTRLQAAQSTLHTDKELLGSLIVASYRINTSGSAVTALIESQDLGQALDTVVSYGQVSTKMESLVLSMRNAVTELASLQVQQQQEQQAAAAQANAIQNLESQATQAETHYQQEASHLTGQAAALTQQLDAVLMQLAAADGVQAAQLSAQGGASGSIGGAPAPFSLGPRVDDFPWGQCTWYVASLRDVTWGGDAWEWAAAAAAQHHAEGLIPKPNAIVVFGRGNGYSGVGHVGYVDSVTGPTSFIVDEANYYGLGVTDKRPVSSLADVEAFIY